MDADEKQICQYLKSLHGQYISGREIARRAGGKWRYEEDPNWASPRLSQLVEKGIIESDSTGHYCLVIKKKVGGGSGGKWVSPQMREIFKKSGKNYTHVIKEEDTDDV